MRKPTPIREKSPREFSIHFAFIAEHIQIVDFVYFRTPQTLADPELKETLRVYYLIQLGQKI